MAGCRGNSSNPVPGGRHSTGCLFLADGEGLNPDPVRYRTGDRVEYTARPVYDGIIWTGDIGVVVRCEGGWVFARWRSGEHSVPLHNVRPAPLDAGHRVVTEVANRRLWGLFTDDDLLFRQGRESDPYLEAGCHPDIVSRIWDELGPTLPADTRARAKGVPVLAHPESNRIFAAAHGTRYALWLTPPDIEAAALLGASTSASWAGGSVTDLREMAGDGWVWGGWYSGEPGWLRRSYRAAGEAWD
jgi:hypothetical protein